MSVRGATIICASIIIFSVALASTLVFAIVQWSNGNKGGDTLDNKTASASDAFDSINLITIHLLNVVTGSVIALILRYESTLSPGALQLSKDSEFSPIKASECDANSESADEISPIANLRSMAVTIPRKSTYVPAPLFHLSLATFFVVHVPALLLIDPRFSYLYTSTDIPVGFRTFMAFVAEMPPQFWAMIAVPAVVAIAAKVRGDGKEMWKYSEHWIFIHEKKKQSEAQAIAPVVEETFVDVKA